MGTSDARRDTDAEQTGRGGFVFNIAPRPFVAVDAKRDIDFDVRGVRDVIRAAAPDYRLSDKRPASHKPSIPTALTIFPRRREQA